jgi:hypothetical protein
MLITEGNIRKWSPDIAGLYDRNPALFKKHYDHEYLTLIVYIWYEQLKGSASFWHPYFETINTCDMCFTWDSEQMDEF